MKVAVSKCKSKFDKYLNWLEHFGVKYEVLNYEEDNKKGMEMLTECSALILTGGTDIYPEIYCDWDTTKTKGTYEPERDGFELNLLGEAIKLGMPVLAICRGSQLVNVYFRGSLIFDIEEIRGISYRKIPEGKEHNEIEINIYNDTLLHRILGSDTAKVVVSNNQAVERVGEGLMINSRSKEGIAEGIEYSDKEGKNFLLGIQWHPERYSDYDTPVSVKLINTLIEESKKFIS